MNKSIVILICTFLIYGFILFHSANSSYINKVNADDMTTHYVTTKDVNMIDENKSFVCIIPKGSTVTVMEPIDEYHYVLYNGNMGYAEAQYLEH